jgi:hypothetical protein
LATAGGVRVPLICASGSPANLERVNRVELIAERRPDGTVVLRAVVLGPFERLRRLLLGLSASRA